MFFTSTKRNLSMNIIIPLTSPIITGLITYLSSMGIFIPNLKIYNQTKHIYMNDIIGSMIGMATLKHL